MLSQSEDRANMILKVFFLLLSASFVLSVDLECSIFTPDYKTKSDKGCSYYWECEGGVLEEKQCWPFQTFSPSQGRCQFFGVNCSEEAAGIPAEWEKPVCYEGLAPYNTYSYRGCKYFYSCRNGTVTESSCGLALDFDPVSKECLGFWKVNCSIPDTPLPTLSPPKYNLTCDETTPDYATVSGKGCNYYYSCKGGYLTEEKCWFWQDFDPVLSRCASKNTVNCTARVRDVPKPWRKPECSGGIPEYRSPHPWGCEYYYECKNGTLSTEKCSMFWPKFNPEKHDCDLSWRVDCKAGEAVCKEGRSWSERGPSFYKTCVDGVTKERECPTGEVFDSSRGTCYSREDVLAVRTGSDKGKPECDMSTPDYKTVVENRSDCTHYYQCKEGKLSLEKCYPFSYFDPQKADCAYQFFSAYDCSGRPKDVPEPWPLPDCDGRPDFKTPSPWGCKFYLQCLDSILTTQKCPAMKNFDPSKGECLLSGDCKSRPKPTPGITAYPTTSTSSPPEGGSSSATEEISWSTTETTIGTYTEERRTTQTVENITERTTDFTTTTEWTTPNTQEY